MHYYADLHVHIGGTSSGAPVKVTASRSLTFESILLEARFRKGIDIVGIVDCASPEVLKDILRMVKTGDLTTLPGGGLLYRERLVVFPSAEVEVQAGKGHAHFVAYFGTLDQMQSFSSTLKQTMTNPNLSSQKARVAPSLLASWTHRLGGLLFAAHAFTPHKGLLGCCAAHPCEVFEPGELDGIELGLSCDSFLADRIAGLESYPYLSNSDAHSCAKIGREYNVLEMESPTFDEFKMVLTSARGRAIVANYGMNPSLGKYHRTCCLTCGEVAKVPPPVTNCPVCGSGNIVMGVLDRICEIGRKQPKPPPGRPPYRYQVPLEFVPGVGPRTLTRLVERFGSEMAVLHGASYKDLAELAGDRIAEAIIKAREGRLGIQSGGGGTYGRIR